MATQVFGKHFIIFYIKISVRNQAEYLTETSALQQVQKKKQPTKEKKNKGKFQPPRILCNYKPEYEQNT